MPEPNLDDYGPCLALLRLSDRRVQERESVMAKNADEGRDEEVTAGIGRRKMIKLTAGAVIAPALPQIGPKIGRGPAKAQNSAHRFFTPDEFAMLDELSELIIPADEHSPGAREAKVAEFIDGRLAESFTNEPK